MPSLMASENWASVQLPMPACGSEVMLGGTKVPNMVWSPNPPARNPVPAW